MNWRRVRQSLFRVWGLSDPAELEQIRRQAYRDLFSSPKGQEVLADIAMSFGLVSADAPADPYKDAFNAGARWAGLQILEWAGVGEQTLARAVVSDDLSGAFEDEDSSLEN